MAESLEYKAVLSCFDKLVTALKLDPLVVSNELVAERLIPPVDGSVNAQKLAQLLLERIQLSPKRYYDIIKVFSRHEWLEDIVDILQEEHSKPDGASVGVQRSEEFTKSSSSKELSKQGEEASGNCLNLELDCPHKQSSLPIPNPVVRFEELSEDDRKDLFAQMHGLTKEIYIKFKTLLSQVYESLTERVKPKHVVVTLTGDDTMIFDDDDKLDEAKDMFEIFKAIRPHLSYFNYDVLEVLVKVHGTPEDKKSFDEYLKSFASYCRAMPCAEEICGKDDSRPKRVKIMFKLNFDRQRLKADYIKDNIISNIASILKIKPSSLYLCSIRDGCVLLEILIPSFLFNRIFPLTNDQLVSLYREVKVTAIRCDQPSFNVDVETLAKHFIKQKELKSRSEADVSSTTSSQATFDHSSGASLMGYPLMQPPKEFLHFPTKYRTISGLSRSDSPSLHDHEFEKRPPRHARLLHVGSTDIGFTTSSESSSGYYSSDSSMGSSYQFWQLKKATKRLSRSKASSGYLSSDSSVGSSYQMRKTPEGFDYNSFFNKLSEVWGRDPQWNKLRKEWQRNDGEWERLYEEVKQLEGRKNKVKDKESKEDIELKLKLKRLEIELATSRTWKALYQQEHRVKELERYLLVQELKIATNDDMKIEIQRLLERAERELHQWKEWVTEGEHQVSQYEDNLVQLRNDQFPLHK